NKIDAAPVGENGVIDELLGEVKALVEKDGWVYLASTDGGLRVLDLDPVYLKLECSEGEAALKGVSGKFCHDYYPALGVKIIVIQGYKDGKAPFDDKDNAKLRFNGNPLHHRFKLTPLSEFACTESSDINPCGIFKKIPGTEVSIVKLKLEALDGFNKKIIDLDLYIDYKKENTVIEGGKDSGGRRVLPINVRHNGNVTLEEVLNGTAVFTFDNNINHSGSYREADLIKEDGSKKAIEERDNTKRFYFIQEMLNQVIPRKRELRRNGGAVNYNLLNEDGRYNQSVVDALQIFKDSFNMAGIDTDRIKYGNTLVDIEYENGAFKAYRETDRTSNIFKKMMKDYGMRDVDGVSSLWLNKVIDNGLLVGNTETTVRSDTPTRDQYINFAPLNHVNDTGLYELYKNVVEPFNKAMITEMERYAGRPVNFEGEPIEGELPTESWTSRLNDANVPFSTYASGGVCNNNKEPVVDALNQGHHCGGMAYSFGGKQTVEEFNNTVSRWPAPPNSKYESIENTFNTRMVPRPDTGGIDINEALDMTEAERQVLDITVRSWAEYNALTESEKLALNNSTLLIVGDAAFTIEADSALYRGNIDDATGLVSTAVNNSANRWPGLYSAHSGELGTAEEYKVKYWAGTDCMGIIWNALQEALNHFDDDVIKLGKICGANRVGNNPNDIDNLCPDNSWISLEESGSLGWFSAAQFNKDAEMHNNVYYHYVNNNNHQDNLHRGDFGTFAPHAYAVYSDRWGAVNSRTFEWIHAEYDVIHAFGFDCNDVRNDERREDCVDENWWYRKVGVTANHRHWLLETQGFGRLMLWD
ncbi:MAG: hypothetical protein OEV42_20890, partial [Deltaproteobacteria bacterium]|nr:hypothetical protein [Deltaproteobacteria bacterium]